MQPALPMAGPPDRGTPACIPAPSYVEARELAQGCRLPAVVEWLLEAAPVASTVVAASGPERVEFPACLMPLCVVFPQPVLGTAIDAIDNLLAAAHRLTLPTVAMNEQVEYQLGCLLFSLRSLVLAHPPGLRRIETSAGTLAAVAATLSTLSSLSGEPTREHVHEMMMVLAPATSALATSPGALRLLVKWASTRCRTGSDQEMAASAAAVALWVAVHVLRGGAERLPSALRTAGAAWEHLQVTHSDVAAAHTGALLGDLAARGSAALAEVEATPPWRLDTFPVVATAVLRDSQLRHCWQCGCPWRIDAAASGASGTSALPSSVFRRRGTTLRVCSGCRVAYYCSPACAKTHWCGGRGGHKAACPRWARYRQSRETTVQSENGGGTLDGPLSRAELFPTTGIVAEYWQPPLERWLWPIAVAKRAEAAGLVMADVVVVADPGSATLLLLPAAEYVHWPMAVPANCLEEQLNSDHGRVMRVVFREHPPRVMGWPLNLIGLSAPGP